MRLRSGNDTGYTPVQRVQAFLDAIETSTSTKGKVSLTRKMYTYLMTVPEFLVERTRFQYTTVTKMNELRQDPAAAKLYPTFATYDRFIENLPRDNNLRVQVGDKVLEFPYPYGTQDMSQSELRYIDKNADGTSNWYYYRRVL
jgi:hypothetical protein